MMSKTMDGCEWIKDRRLWTITLDSGKFLLMFEIPELVDVLCVGFLIGHENLLFNDNNDDDLKIIKVCSLIFYCSI